MSDKITVWKKFLSKLVNLTRMMIINVAQDANAMKLSTPSTKTNLKIIYRLIARAIKKLLPIYTKSSKLLLPNTERKESHPFEDSVQS